MPALEGVEHHGRYRDRRLTTPTLWLHGSADPVVTPALFDDIGEHADDVRIEYLPECGHFPPEEQPQLVAEHVRAFFAPDGARAQPGV